MSDQKQSPPFDRAAARALCEAATDGPWTVSDPAFGFRGVLCQVGSVCGMPANASYPAVDADFIANARADLPAALDLLDRCDAMLRRLEGAIDAEMLNGTGEVVDVIRMDEIPRAEFGRLMLDLKGGRDV